MGGGERNREDRGERKIEEGNRVTRKKKNKRQKMEKISKVALGSLNLSSATSY